MLNLEKLIRIKVIAQSLHDPPNANSLRERTNILNRSLWIYCDFDFNARVANPTKSPIKLLSRQRSIKLPIYQYTRILSIDNYQRLRNNFQRKSSYPILLESLPEDRAFSKIEFKQDDPNFESQFKKEIQSWNILRYRGKYWHWRGFEKAFEDEFNIENIKNEDLVIHILKLYPILNLFQISKLSGISIDELDIPISKCIHQGKIIRNLNRSMSPSEYFADEDLSIIEQEKDIDWDLVPLFVIDHRDSLGEIIKLEKDFKHSTGNYWLFIHGLPTIEFKLKKLKGSNSYKVQNISRLLNPNLELNFVIDELKKWAEGIGLNIEINLASNEYADSANFFVKFLLSRGYQKVSSNLILNKSGSISKKSTIIFDEFGPWLREKQGFNLIKLENLADMHLQFDDINSITFRVGEIDIKKLETYFIYTMGVNYRLGLVSKLHLQDIIFAYPKQSTLKNLDRKILDLLDNNPSSLSDLSTAIDRTPADILGRLRYLELSRLIVRSISKDMNAEKCSWSLFPRSDLTIGDNSKISQSRTKLLITLLKINIPLTKNQISKYFGITINDLDLLVKQLISTNLIIEGYFIDGVKDIQITLSNIVGELEGIKLIVENNNNITDLGNNPDNDSEDEVTEIDEDEIILEKYTTPVDILPQNDVLTMFLLSDLILSEQVLQITSRLPTYSEIFMIDWGGIPIGYIIRYPSEMNIIDFDIELRIKKKMNTNIVFSSIIERIGFFLHRLTSDELRIVSINKEPVRGKKYQHLHFIIESVGIHI